MLGNQKGEEVVPETLFALVSASGRTFVLKRVDAIISRLKVRAPVYMGLPCRIKAGYINPAEQTKA